jgi:hypothetical protein
MEVGYKKEAFVLFLKENPVLQASNPVPQMKLAGRSISREDSPFRYLFHE